MVVGWYVIVVITEVAEASLLFTDRLNQPIIKLQSLLVFLHLGVSGLIMS